jgi:hypothetical protein
LRVGLSQNSAYWGQIPAVFLTCACLYQQILAKAQDLSVYVFLYFSNPWGEPLMWGHDFFAHSKILPVDKKSNCGSL